MTTIWRDRINGRYILYVVKDDEQVPVSLKWAMTEIRHGRAKLIDKFKVRLTDDITEPPVTFSFEALQYLTGKGLRPRRRP
jgi:hypothetical protein